MNPILAILLIVFLVSIGLSILHLIVTHIVATDIAKHTAFSTLSQDKLLQEIRKRWLGRFGEIAYPLAFWWLYAGLIIWHLLFRRRA